MALLLALLLALLFGLVSGPESELGWGLLDSGL